mmetsp:Transcript_107/g.153  ORF Transcript_107/g.153 Transcript_107/m.153 type:complete len:554 (-) Transcript_107:140-1801(-)
MKMALMKFDEDGADRMPTPPATMGSTSPYTRVARRHEMMVSSTSLTPKRKNSAEYWHLSRRFFALCKKYRPESYERLLTESGPDQEIFADIWPKGISRMPHCGMMNLNVFMLLGGDFTTWAEMHINVYNTNVKLTALMMQGQATYKKHWRDEFKRIGHVDYKYSRTDAPVSGKKRKRSVGFDMYAGPVAVPPSKKRKMDDGAGAFETDLQEAMRLSQEQVAIDEASREEYRSQLDHALSLSQEHEQHSGGVMYSPYARPRRHSYNGNSLSLPFLSPALAHSSLNNRVFSPIYENMATSSSNSVPAAIGKRNFASVPFPLADENYENEPPFASESDPSFMTESNAFDSFEYEMQNEESNAAIGNNTSNTSVSGGALAQLQALNEKLGVKAKPGTKAVPVKKKKEKAKSKKREKRTIEQNTAFVKENIEALMSGKKEFGDLFYTCKSIIGATIVDYLRQHESYDCSALSNRMGMRSLLYDIGGGREDSYHFAGFHVDDRLTLKQGVGYVPDDEIAQLVKVEIIDYEKNNTDTDAAKKAIAKNLIGIFREKIFLLA